MHILHALCACIRIFWRISAGQTLLLFLLQLAKGALAPLSLLLIQHSVDALLPSLAEGAASAALLSNVAALGGVLLGAEVCGWLAARVQSCLKNEAQRVISREVVDKFSKVEFACLEDPAALDDVKAMRQTPAAEIFDLFTQAVLLSAKLVTLAGTALVLLRYSTPVCALYLLATVAMVFFELRGMLEMNQVLDAQTADERRLDSLQGLLHNKESAYELHVNGGVEMLRSKIQKILSHVLRNRMHKTVYAQRWAMCSYAVEFLWLAASVPLLAVGLQQGALQLGAFTAVAGCIGSSLQLTESLSLLFSQIMRQNRVITHYRRFLALPEEKPAQAPAAIAAAQGSHPFVEFRNVSFHYPGTEKQVLRHVSFSIGRTERVGLVGRNGCGKSTILKLLLRLYHPDQGEIRVDGRPLESLTRAQIHEAFSAVLQSFGHYALTIRENVILSDNERPAKESRIRQALKDVHFSQQGLALEQPLGKLQEEGVDLSGGQWQRLALARALYARADMLLLDEPTASLDPIAESRLYREFACVLQGKGAVLVTHRLASVQQVDRILVLDKGGIIEDGSHAALMQKRGLYSRMYESQARWYRDGGKAACI